MAAWIDVFTSGIVLSAILSVSFSFASLCSSSAVFLFFVNSSICLSHCLCASTSPSSRKSFRSLNFCSASSSSAFTRSSTFAFFSFALRISSSICFNLLSLLLVCCCRSPRSALVTFVLGGIFNFLMSPSSSEILFLAMSMVVWYNGFSLTQAVLQTTSSSSICFSFSFCSIVSLTLSGSVSSSSFAVDAGYAGFPSASSSASCFFLKALHELHFFSFSVGFVVPQWKQSQATLALWSLPCCVSGVFESLALPPLPLWSPWRHTSAMWPVLLQTPHVLFLCSHCHFACPSLPQQRHGPFGGRGVVWSCVPSLQPPPFPRW